jgi:type I restriction enzyme S subunit
LRDYLELAIKHALAELQAQTHGTTMLHIKRKPFEDTRIPVPSLSKQRQLVARVEGLMAHLKKARQARQAALFEAPQIFTASMASLLGEHKATSVPLHTLLSTQPRNGWSPPSEFQTGHGLPVLTLSAVTGFVYDGSRVTLTTAPTKSGAHYWLDRDELLITRSNTPELVGHAAIYDGTPSKVICCDLIMKMKVDPTRADVRFIHYCLRSPAIRQFIFQRAKGSSGTMNKISKQDVQEIPIPDIPLDEQQRIVRRLDALIAKDKQLRRLQTETEAELAAFTPALLAKAFKREL